MSEVQGLLNCCKTSGSEDKVMRSCQSMIVMRQLSQQQSLGSEDLKVWWDRSSDQNTELHTIGWQDVNAAIKNGDHDGVIRAIQKQKFPLWKCVNEDSDQQISGTGDCHCFPIRLMSLKLTFYQRNIRQAFTLIYVKLTFCFIGEIWLVNNPLIQDTGPWWGNYWRTWSMETR